MYHLTTLALVALAACLWTLGSYVTPGVAITSVVGTCVLGAIHDARTRDSAFAIGMNAIPIGVLSWLFAQPLLYGLTIYCSEDVMADAILFSLVFIIGSRVAATAAWQWLSNWSVAPSDVISEPKNERAAVVIIMLMYAIGFAPLVFYAHGSLSALWVLMTAGYRYVEGETWRRAALGSARDFWLTVLRLVLLAGYFSSLWLVVRPRIAVRVWERGFLLLGVFGTLAVLYFEGSRFVFGFAAIGAAVFWAVARDSGRRRLAAVGLTVGIALLALLGSQVEGRTRNFSFDGPSEIIATGGSALEGESELRWFAEALRTMPVQYDFTYDWPFLSLLTHPIPRFLWPDKPAATGWPFLRWYQVQFTTLTCSVVGDFYICAGLAGVVLGAIVYGFAAGVTARLGANAKRGSFQSLVFIVAILMLFLGVRSFDTFVNHWYILPLMCAVPWFTQGHVIREKRS